MRRDIAEQINRLMMEYQSKLNATTLLVQETCSEEEFQGFRQAVGRATDYMFMELTRAMQMSSTDAQDDAHDDAHDDAQDDFEDDYPEYEEQTAKLLV